MKQIETIQVPERACDFPLEQDDCSLAEASAEGEQRFTILANSGKPIPNHWFWGNLGIDLSGIKGKAKIPALLDHDVTQRIGVSDAREVEPRRGLVMQGHFLKNSPLAAQVRSESKDGFPWEASVRLIPTKIERLSEGVETEVNGNRIVGPGHIFRKSELREVSFTALGADPNTSAAALSNASPELAVEISSTATTNGETMTDKNKVAPAPAPDPAPEQLSADTIRKQAVDAERARVAEIRKHAIPEQAALVEELVVGGAEISNAQARLADDLRNKFKQLAQQLKIGDKPLSPGNIDQLNAGATRLAEVAAMGESPDKWAAQWESDAKLHAEYLRKDDYIALRHCELARWNPARIRPLRDGQGRLVTIAAPYDALALAASSPSTPVTIAGVRAGYALSLQAQLGLSWAREIASVFSSTSPTETYPWLRATPRLRKWEGERSTQELKGDGVTLFNEEWETTIEFRLPDLRRDKTDQIQARINDVALDVAVHPDELLSTMLTANGNAYDGVAFFATNHGVGGQTINNAKVAGDGLAGGASPTTAQQSSNILLLMSSMLGFLGDTAKPINHGARRFAVMVPANMFGATVAAINAMFTSASATNPLGELARFGYSFEPILNARLTTTNQMYMFRSDAGIRSLLLQEETVIPMELGPESEHAKKTNRAMFGHGWSGQVGYGRFELAIRGVTS